MTEPLLAPRRAGLHGRRRRVERDLARDLRPARDRGGHRRACARSTAHFLAVGADGRPGRRTRLLLPRRRRRRLRQARSRSSIGAAGAPSGSSSTGTISALEASFDDGEPPRVVGARRGRADAAADDPADRAPTSSVTDADIAARDRRRARPAGRRRRRRARPTTSCSSSTRATWRSCASGPADPGRAVVRRTARCTSRRAPAAPATRAHAGAGQRAARRSRLAPTSPTSAARCEVTGYDAGQRAAIDEEAGARRRRGRDRRRPHRARGPRSGRSASARRCRVREAPLDRRARRAPGREAEMLRRARRVRHRGRARRAARRTWSSAAG